MSKIKSRFIDTTDNYTFSGTVDVTTPPSGANSVTNKDYVDDQIDQVSVFRSEDLTYTDTTNKVIALPSAVENYLEVTVFVINGNALMYGTDYTIRNVGSTAYLCIDPSSTAPSGSFDSGDASNPSVGILGFFLSNDHVRVLYATLGLGGGGTVPGPQGLLGARGFQGVQGTAGGNGNGTQGVAGVQGFTGAGFQGTAGTNGTNGVQGATGPQGSTGTNGFQGATGSGSLIGFTTTDNTAYGSGALGALSSATGNTAVGVNALSTVSTQTNGNNVAVGLNAGAAITSATHTVCIGKDAGLVNTASENLFIGGLAGRANTSGTRQVCLGYNAGNIATGGSNVFVGWGAAAIHTTGTGNVIIGSAAGAASVSASSNTLIGSNAASSCTGSTNTLVGASVGQSLTSGFNNTGLGSQSLATCSTGSYNTVIGRTAGTSAGATVGAVVIGDNATGSDYSIVIGSRTGGGGSTDNGFASCLVLSQSAYADTIGAPTAANTAVFGSSLYPYNVFNFGAGASINSPSASTGYILRATSAIGVNNTEGGKLVLAGGLSTGTGVRGKLVARSGIESTSTASTTNGISTQDINISGVYYAARNTNALTSASGATVLASRAFDAGEFSNRTIFFEVDILFSSLVNLSTFNLDIRYNSTVLHTFAIVAIGAAGSGSGVIRISMTVPALSSSTTALPASMSGCLIGSTSTGQNQDDTTSNSVNTTNGGNLDLRMSSISNAGTWNIRGIRILSAV